MSIFVDVYEYELLHNIFLANNKYQMVVIQLQR